MSTKYHVIEILADQLVSEFLDDFDRFQEITHVYRGSHGNKTKQYNPFKEIWGKSEKHNRVSELRDTLETGGTVFGLYNQNNLVGFASINGNFIDPDHCYRQLLELHITAAYRRKGLGRILFQTCVNKLKSLGVRKMYISSHSSVETVSFYKNLGCTDAQWLYTEQIQNEPFDYQLEYSLQ